MRDIEIQLQAAESARDRLRDECSRMIRSRKCVGTITVDDSGLVFFQQNHRRLKTGQYFAFVECSEFDDAGILKRPTIKLEDN